MKKRLIALVALSVVITVCTSVSACNIFKNKQSTEKVQATMPSVPLYEKNAIEVLPTMNSKRRAENSIWVGTFQLVWNDVIDTMVKRPIEFVEGPNVTAENLNKREINKEDISEDSYYIKSGVIKPELKKEIEKGIKEKFDETSDILGMIDFTYDPNKYLFYAMLKKDFKFLEPFDKLEEEQFGANPVNVKYFGIDANSQSTLYKNVSVLFYNKHNDYAVSIHTKGDDEVILYRTDDEKNLNEYYAEIKEKTQDFEDSKFFGSYDRLKVPDIKLYQMQYFTDLMGKNIVNSNLRIDQALETVDFRMNNEGVKLKSEAAIVMKATAMPGPPPRIRKFYFNDKFVLFLIEKGKTVPYFAMRVSDIEAVNNTSNK